MFNLNSCAICGYIITDSVCRDCYIKQTKALLQDIQMSSMINDFISIEIKSHYPIDTMNDAECILCKNDQVSVCNYCFSVMLIRILREINVPEDLIENFRYHPAYEETFLENPIYETSA